MQTWAAWTIGVGGAFLIATALGVIGIWIFQHRFLYFPDPSRTEPVDCGLLTVRETVMATPDGEQLIVWRAAPASPASPVVLYLHGNARALSKRAKFFGRFLGEGWGLVAISHRGFGGSTGIPSERANVADALQLYDELRAEGVEPERIVVYGESLGSGTAVQVAAQRACGGLVLHAPMDSVENIAQWRVPLIVPGRMLRDRYRSIDYIGRVTAPILWMHGDADGVIPMRFGKRLYDAATAPRFVALVPGAGHFGLYSSLVFQSHIRLFINGVVPAAASDLARLRQDPRLPDAVAARG